MAPPGTKILAHSKPNKRASWAYHGQTGWYVGPATEHYRCATCYMPKTHRQIITDTIRFIPSHIPIPEASIDDHIRNSLQELTSMLSNKFSTYPSTISSPTNRQALIQLAGIFNRDVTNQPTDLTSKGEGYNTPPTTQHSYPPKKMTEDEFIEFMKQDKQQNSVNKNLPRVDNQQNTFASPHLIQRYPYITH